MENQEEKETLKNFPGYLALKVTWQRIYFI